MLTNMVLENWKYSSLKDAIAKVIGGGTPPRAIARYWQGSISWASVKDFQDDMLLLHDTQEHISREGLRKSAANEIEPNTLVICTRMAIGRAAIVESPTAINQDLKALYPKSHLQTKFLLYFLHQNRQMLETLSIGSTVKGITTNKLLSLTIGIPPTDEQSSIAHILDTLDTQIQQTEQLIAKLKQIKVGLLHDLLTRGIDEHGDMRDPVAHPERFQISKLGKIPQEWDILLIKEAGIVQLGRQRSPRYQTGHHTMPYLRVANVFDGFIGFSDILSMDFNPEERKRYNLIPGDILLNEGQSLELVGRSAIYQGPPDTYCFQNTLVRFTCNSRTIPEYCRAVFKYWLNTSKFTTVAKRTTSIAHLGADRFARMSLCVPSLDEQHRIAVIFNSHNARITAEETGLAKLKQLKKGLMHDLLTGRVRVTQLMAESEQLDVQLESVFDCK